MSAIVNQYHVLSLFCFSMVNMVMCQKQKFQVKRCRSLKKIENHWAKKTFWVEEESKRRKIIYFGFLLIN
jgi:hypothetical protein